MQKGSYKVESVPNKTGVLRITIEGDSKSYTVKAEGKAAIKVRNGNFSIKGGKIVV